MPSSNQSTQRDDLMKRDPNRIPKILVTGGRNFGRLPKDKNDPTYTQRKREKELVECELNKTAMEHDAQGRKDVHWIFGDATGVDAIVWKWAKSCYDLYDRYKAQWTKLGKSAGPLRNQQMLDENPDIELVLAFPGGVGTKDMISRAKKAGIKVLQFKTPKDYNPKYRGLTFYEREEL